MRDTGGAGEAIRATSEPDFLVEDRVFEHADQAFGGPSAALGQIDHQKERDELFRKIGELEMYRDFLKKA